MPNHLYCISKVQSVSMAQFGTKVNKQLKLNKTADLPKNHNFLYLTTLYCVIRAISGLYTAVLYKYGEETNYHPLTCSLAYRRSLVKTGETNQMVLDVEALPLWKALCPRLRFVSFRAGNWNCCAIAESERFFSLFTPL